MPLHECVQWNTLVLLGLGALYWSLYALDKLGIDIELVLCKGSDAAKEDQDTNTRHELRRLASRLSLYIALVFLVSYAPSKSTKYLEYAVTLCPFIYLALSKSKLMHGLKTQLHRSLSNPQVTHLDVYFADTLTSYARALPMLLPSSPQYLKALLIAGPFWIRLRQCLSEAYHSTGVNRNRHLCNSVKYGLAFPVIALASFPAYNTFWQAFTVMSTLSNIYWDLYVDWMFPWPKWMVSYSILVRALWMLRAFKKDWVSPNVQFALIALEVWRRAVWIVLRTVKLSTDF